jgi:hypothetical protein
VIFSIYNNHIIALISDVFSIKLSLMDEKIFFSISSTKGFVINYRHKVPWQISDSLNTFEWPKIQWSDERAFELIFLTTRTINHKWNLLIISKISDSINHFKIKIFHNKMSKQTLFLDLKLFFLLDLGQKWIFFYLISFIFR